MKTSHVDKRAKMSESPVRDDSFLKAIKITAPKYNNKGEPDHDNKVSGVVIVKFDKLVYRMWKRREDEFMQINEDICVAYNRLMKQPDEYGSELDGYSCNYMDEEVNEVAISGEPHVILRASNRYGYLANQKLDNIDDSLSLGSSDSDEDEEDSDEDSDGPYKEIHRKERAKDDSDGESEDDDEENEDEDENEDDEEDEEEDD